MKRSLKLFLPAIIVLVIGCSTSPESIKDSEVDHSIVVEQSVDVIDTAMLLKNRCLICHGVGETHDDLIAPPMRGVKMHYLQEFPEKSDFIAAYIAWASNPVAENSLMPGALEQFEVMANLKYDTNDIALIAAFVYDNKMPKPAWAGHGHGVGM